MALDMLKVGFAYEETPTSEDGLLENQQDGEFAEYKKPLSAKQGRRLAYLRSPVVLHLFLLTAYTLFFCLAIRHFAKRYERGPDLIYSPAREAVTYEKKFLHNDVFASNPYRGEPSPDLDAAWHELFVYNNLRVTKEELDRMNRTSVQLADGSGDYLATLDVYHHLHCLKYIRHYLHPEYYTIPESNVPKIKHVDHCLDAIRQELMCRAEITMTTYDWIPDLRIPWAHLSYEHECVSFEAIHAWAKTRAFDISDPKYLVHPTLGTSFPPGSKE